MKSEIMDPKNRNQSECNLLQEEVQALKDLIKLQRDRKIVIKACDKGSGIIILNLEDYLRSCYEHLISEQIQEDGTALPFYIKVGDFAVEEAQLKILEVLEDGLNKGIISRKEFSAMNPEDKDVGRFYCNFKVHKEYTKVPPPRPINSGIGSITENISLLESSHKNLSNKHNSYIQDTPDFLREIDKIN